MPNCSNQKKRNNFRKKEINQRLNEQWKFGEEERADSARWASLTSNNNSNGIVRAQSRSKETVKLTARSNIGRFLRSPETWSQLTFLLPEDDYEDLIQKLVKVLG